MKNICILGATGSIGLQTIDVIRHEKDNFNLTAVSCNTSYDKIISIIEEFTPKYVAVADKNTYGKVLIYCKNKNIKTNVLQGIEAMEEIVKATEVDLVVTSIVGMVGLKPTICAIEHGKDIALANKETLVVGGEIVIKKVKEKGINLLPVDSEHGAIFQCLQGNKREDIKTLYITASGGPFRGYKRKDLVNITPKDALKHPKWNMGKKISIDSATLMNKGLEVIEAHYLFGCDYKNIKAVIHKESVVHSMIEYKDNSIMAQMAVADMRLPIQYALNYPSRREFVVDSLDLFKVKNLSFEEPDTETFKPLSLAYKAGIAGGLYPTILNGANEACVDLFLKEKISFLEIGDIIEDALNKFDGSGKVSVDNIINTDRLVKNNIYTKYLK